MQCFEWLKTGDWKPIGMGEFWEGHPLPTSNWKGFQKILDWFFDFPLPVGAILIGIGRRHECLSESRMR
jgi:hypothetical protein